MLIELFLSTANVANIIYKVLILSFVFELSTQYTLCGQIRNVDVDKFWISMMIKIKKKVRSEIYKHF